jgi:hypothetical protein
MAMEKGAHTLPMKMKVGCTNTEVPESPQKWHFCKNSSNLLCTYLPPERILDWLMWFQNI